MELSPQVEVEIKEEYKEDTFYLEEDVGNDNMDIEGMEEEKSLDKMADKKKAIKRNTGRKKVIKEKENSKFFFCNVVT